MPKSFKIVGKLSVEDRRNSSLLAARAAVTNDQTLFPVIWISEAPKQSSFGVSWNMLFFLWFHADKTHFAVNVTS